MSEKNIYDALNDVDGSVENFERVDLTDMEKDRLKKDFNFKKKRGFNFKRFGAVAAAVALALVIFGQTGLGQFAYAKIESTLGGLSYSIAKSLYLKKDVEPYVNVVNKLVEDKGVGIKLTECAIDKDEFILTFLFESSDGENYGHTDADYSIKINGIRVGYLGASGSAGRVDGEENIFFETMSYDVKDIDTEEELDVVIEMDKIEFDDENGNIKTVKGDWVFEFNASGKELALNTKVIKLDNLIDCGDFEIRLEELRLNPVNKKLYAKVVDSAGKYEYQTFGFRGYDDLGNEVEFGMRRYDGKTKEAILSIEELHSNLSDEAKSISLTTFVSELPKGGGRIGEAVPMGESFTIDLEK